MSNCNGLSLSGGADLPQTWVCGVRSSGSCSYIVGVNRWTCFRVACPQLWAFVWPLKQTSSLILTRLREYNNHRSPPAARCLDCVPCSG
eukprot:10592683-Lingulodinium_polyedra.AAC.1